ncbi:hypothetical protein SRABI76_02692 [Microbacterium oxydans]|uniref:Uncharacterized protein n=1 Tax=Microbacterium oxydans TaxID=82380 RepID=A0A0F0LCQ6_9MICO|nr:hypothetical protein [Microbacterium oxydans]KJL29326.1 hypothetical protein RS83_01955 [Microbacterium oxydans]CAH0228566.1 hypothetical protein SRABI76_02692 [Microbacterium oxydans]
MLGADERDELRALQARAYGRGGELSEPEAGRLRELSRRRAGPTPVTPTPGLISGVPEALVGTSHADEHAASTPGMSTDDVQTDAAPRSLRSAIVAHWRPALIAVVGAMIIGIGAGWLLFGRSGVESIELTPQQQEWQTALADGGYDPGSVRPVAGYDGVVLWYATKMAGEKTCLVIGDGDQTEVACQDTASVRVSGVSTRLVVEGEQQTEISGHLLLSPGGQPAVMVSASVISGEVEPMFANPEEERFAAGLVDQGFKANTVFVVGYDGDNAIWTGFHPENGAQCLIYAASADRSVMHCGENGVNEDLWIEYVDPKSGEPTRAEWNRASSVGANLVIIRSGDTGDAAEE